MGTALGSLESCFTLFVSEPVGITQPTLPPLGGEMGQYVRLKLQSPTTEPGLIPRVTAFLPESLLELQGPGPQLCSGHMERCTQHHVLRAGLCLLGTLVGTPMQPPRDSQGTGTCSHRPPCLSRLTQGTQIPNLNQVQEFATHLPSPAALQGSG